MQAVILAAGKGTRLRPLTLRTPKPLIKVGEKTILEYNLESLPSEIDEILVVVNYLQEVIREYLGSNWLGTPLKYVEQKELNGTAGALQAARSDLQERFLVINGDDIYPKNALKEMCQQELAMLTTEIQDPSTAATCALNADGTLKDVIEAGKAEFKPPYLANCGAYTLDHSFFDVPAQKIPNGELGLPQTLVKLAQRGSAISLPRTQDWWPIGTPAQLQRANDYFAKI